VIPDLRRCFNSQFTPQGYALLIDVLERRCGVKIGFRVAETPIFVPLELMEEMAKAGVDLALELVGDPSYLEAARRAIPANYVVAGETEHPNFLTADFALVRDEEGELVPRLVEIQAFPSVYGYQAELCRCYQEAFGLDGWSGGGLGFLLSGLREEEYWDLLRRTIVDGLDPENVILTEIDPTHQKTRPDFEVTAGRLGIATVDIRELVAEGNRLHYRNGKGQLVPIERIYNRAIADELIARKVRLPFDLTRAWDVEWAGHPNWYFLISKFSIPWLTRPAGRNAAVPPAVFLNDFLDGNGRVELEQAGVRLPANTGRETVYSELLLKPLFSFAGKGIQFDPTQEQLEAIPPAERGGFLLQQRMHFEPNIETPHGLTQAEIRILYLWPEDGRLTPVLSLVRLGRGKMMGVDHNRDQEWVGASAGFFPRY
jgi:hypothetical protein